MQTPIPTLFMRNPREPLSNKTGHPAGVATHDSVLLADWVSPDNWQIDAWALLRTARLIMRGEATAPTSVRAGT